MTLIEFILHAVDFIEGDENNMKHHTACFDYIENHLLEVLHVSIEDTKLAIQAIQEIFYGKHPELRIVEVRAMQQAFASVCLN